MEPATERIIVVYFPNILLGMYAVIEVLRLPKLTRQTWYTPLKCAFLFLGTATGILAFVTGYWAINYNSGGASGPLLDVHHTWASLSLWIFAVLSACYLLMFISKKAWFMNHVEAKFKRAGMLFPAMAGAILRITPVGACIGFVAIIITGALGCAVANGPETNTFVSFVYHLLLR